jgi:hypothetical protein
MRTLVFWMMLPLLFSVRGLDRPEAVARAAPGPVVKVPAKPVPAEVHFQDGSVVKVALLQDTIQVATRYGKLFVPAREVKEITFGRRFPEGVRKRIDAAVARLGGRDFKDREKASAELLALGELSYAALVRAEKSRDLEVAKRAKELVEALAAKYSEERLLAPAHDVLDTEAFTIIGHVTSPTLRVSTAYFGEARLRLGDLRNLRTSAAEGDVLRVRVDAAKWAGPAPAWLETRAQVRARTELRIRAAGKVDLYPLPNWVGQYMSGPGGLPRAGAVGPQGHPPGALLGRIGKNGTPFLIGEDYRGRPAEGGKLYLSIAPSPWNNASSGEYIATIRLGPER